MKFGVVVFPGSNCDDDMIHVLGTVMGAEVKKVWHKDTSLKAFSTDDCLILPGGFSYGDYLRSGAIARFSPIMQAVIRFAQRGGNVWGICNGFQVLCEARLLPGALMRNERQKFIARDVYIQKVTDRSLLTRHLPDRPLRIPIAHAEGRFFAKPETLHSLEENNQILFRYCDAQGATSTEANPNGSVQHIAGICNEDRNVFGMMPHPERAAEALLGNTDGKLIFESLMDIATA